MYGSTYAHAQKVWRSRVTVSFYNVIWFEILVNNNLLLETLQSQTIKLKHVFKISLKSNEEFGRYRAHNQFHTLFARSS